MSALLRCRSIRYRAHIAFSGNGIAARNAGEKGFGSRRHEESGPLLDRIDLHVEVPAVDFRELTAKKHAGESSATIRARVTAARDIQTLRFATSNGVTTNAAMRPKQVREHCALDTESQGYLEQAMDQMHLSARAHDRILKVARTIADLARSENTQSSQILMNESR